MSPPECCIWCGDSDNPLATGKAYCTKCQSKGQECVRCKRPMPAKYYTLNSHRCNACHKKYLKERKDKKRTHSPSSSELDDEEDLEIKQISDSDISPPEEEEEPKKKKKTTKPAESTPAAAAVPSTSSATPATPKPKRQYQRRKKVPPIVQAVNDTLKNRTVFIPIIWPEDVNKV